MEKTFYFDENINLPKNITHKYFKSKHLIIAPEKASWLVLDDICASMLLFLFQGLNIGKAISCAGNLFNLNRDLVLTKAKQLLKEIENKSFYESTVSKDFPSSSSNLFYFHFYLTRACNLKCFYCYMNAGTALSNELSTSEWKKTIDFINEKCPKSTIAFSGGEPLLNKGVFDIASYAKSAGHITNLITNGTLLNKNQIPYLKKYIDSIQISIDGATEQVNDSIRGRGVYAKVINSINLLLDADLKVELAIQALPENLNDLENNIKSLMKSFRNLKLDITINNKLLNLGRAKCLPKKYFSFATAGRRRIDKIFNVLSAFGFEKKSLREVNHRFWNCGLGYGVTVDANGDIYPCADLYLKFGNIRSSNISKVMDRIFELQEATKIDKMKKCVDCELKFICAGGCRLINHRKNGNFLIPTCDEFTKEQVYLDLIYS